MALYQPVAVDLRRVATVLKINGDLERIADHATNIAEDVIYLVDGEIARHRQDEIALERTIDVHISALRKKLGGHAELIQTVRGIGYRFRDPADVVVSEPSS